MKLSDIAEAKRLSEALDSVTVAIENWRFGTPVRMDMPHRYHAESNQNLVVRLPHDIGKVALENYKAVLQSELRKLGVEVTA